VIGLHGAMVVAGRLFDIGRAKSETLKEAMLRYFLK
jgi:hypothetical protein